MEASIRLLDATKKLVGQKVKKFKWGAGTGSIIKLTFERENISNASNFEFQRENALLVNCAWRLVFDKSFYSWRDSDVREGELRKTLDSCLGLEILGVELQPKTQDLCLKFKGGLEFQVLCDITNDEEADENYILYSDVEILFVDYNVRVNSEPYDSH